MQVTFQMVKRERERTVTQQMGEILAGKSGHTGVLYTIIFGNFSVLLKFFQKRKQS